MNFIRYLYSKKQELKIWVIVLISCLSLASCSTSNECYDSSDVGAGKSIIIKSEVSLNSNHNKMLRNEPKKHQIIAWKDTGLYTIGVKYDQYGNLVSEPIIGKVTGGWYPWSARIGLDCDYVDCSTCQRGFCDKYSSNCISEKHGADHPGTYIKPKRGKKPCLLKNGLGLYGLISVQNVSANYYNDPNKSAIISDIPNAELFRTFHIGNYSDNDGKFTIPHNIVCELLNTDESYKCTKQVTSGVAGKSIALGRLYLKIVDNYYNDNEDHENGYKIVFYNGVYYIGFITEMMTFLQQTLKDSAEALYKNVLKYSLNVIRGLLTLYILITAILFMMGIIKTKISQFVVILLKVSLIAALISPESYTFFKTYFFDLFQSVADTISIAIVNSAFFIEQAGRHMSGKLLDTGNFGKSAGYLAIYDDYINSLFSDAITAKIWSLFFTPKILYIIPIYICIGLLMFVILKALMLYALSFIQTGILIAIFPFCLVTILFQTTKDIFDSWMKYMLSAALILVMVTALTSLMFVFLRTYFDKLFEYPVCWDNIFLFIYFWSPSDIGQLNNAVTTINYFATLFYTFIFYVLLDIVPSLVDSLANSLSLGTVAGSYGAAVSAGKSMFDNFKKSSGISKVWSKTKNKLREFYGTKISPYSIYTRYKIGSEVKKMEKAASKDLKDYNIKSLDRSLDKLKRANVEMSGMINEALKNNPEVNISRDRHVENEKLGMKDKGTESIGVSQKEKNAITPKDDKEDKSEKKINNTRKRTNPKKSIKGDGNEIELKDFKKENITLDRDIGFEKKEMKEGVTKDKKDNRLRRRGDMGGEKEIELQDFKRKEVVVDRDTGIEKEMLSKKEEIKEKSDRVLKDRNIRKENREIGYQEDFKRKEVVVDRDTGIEKEMPNKKEIIKDENDLKDRSIRKENEKIGRQEFKNREFRRKNTGRADGDASSDGHDRQELRKQRTVVKPRKGITKPKKK